LCGAGRLACVAGENREGEGEGEQGHGRKMGDWGLGMSLAPRTPFFSRSPSPSLFTPATQAKRLAPRKIICLVIFRYFNVLIPVALYAFDYIFYNYACHLHKVIF